LWSLSAVENEFAIPANDVTMPEFERPDRPGADAAGLLNRPTKLFDILPEFDPALMADANEP